jgi:cytochrome c biogenesis protein CcmG/thiol:disulfide interchange protein DsbE
MNRVVLALGLLIVLPLVGVLALNIDRNPGSIDSPLIGKQAPTFRLERVVSGPPVDLTELRGRPVVINFWATWCIPCYQEHAVLVSEARRRGGQVEFLGIIYQDEKDRVARFLDERGGGYPNLMDDAGKTAIAYGVYGVPESFFLDASGKVVSKYTGALTRRSLDALLEQAGAEGGPRVELR